MEDVARVQGYLYMLTSTTCFAVVAAVSKAIGSGASTLQKLFWRSLLSVLCTLLTKAWGQRRVAACVAKKGDPQEEEQAGTSSCWSPPCFPGLLVLRGLCGHLALVAFLESLERIPLAEAVFIGKIHPIAAAVFAWCFLGEPLRPTRLIAILASIFGLALIARPSATSLSSASTFGLALATLAGVLSGAAYCCVRALARGGEAESWMLLSLPLVSIPFCARDAWAGVSSVAADMKLVALLLGLAASAQGGQVFLARGLKLLPAAAATQVMYFGAVVSVVLGLLLGDAWPSAQVWAGGGLIAGSLHIADIAERRVASADYKHE